MTDHPFRDQAQEAQRWERVVTVCQGCGHVAGLYRCLRCRVEVCAACRRKHECTG